MATTVTIKKDLEPDPDPVTVDKGAQVNWHNTSGQTITLTFPVPPIFTPPGENPTRRIPDGGWSQTYTLDPNVKDPSYEYKITGQDLVPRTGTIDVG